MGTGRAVTVGGIILAMLMSVDRAKAATDGDLSPLSTGEIVIRLRIEQGIQISQLHDVQLRVNMDTAGGDAVYRERFCVRSNRQTNYRLTAFSDQGGNSPFTLTSPRGDRLRYELAFTGNLSSGVLGRLMPAVPSQTYSVRHSGVNCNGQDNAEIELTIPSSELQAASDSEYTGFLNLSVAIE